jgi:hypothetical protein
MLKIKPLVSALVFTIGGAGSVAQAQLEEVIVTATKRSEGFDKLTF